MEAMAIPIKPGKLETWKSWCGELTGPRKAEFDDMNQRLGLTTHASWHQANPDGSDLAVVVMPGREFLAMPRTTSSTSGSGVEATMDFSAPR